MEKRTTSIRKRNKRDMRIPSYIFSYHVFSGGFWVRIFGGCMVVVDRSKYPPLFSERYGYTKAYRFGSWSIKFPKEHKYRGNDS